MTALHLLKLSWQFSRRDARAGELRLLALALVIAVTALTSVGFFVDRLRSGLHRDAAQLLGGDAVIASDSPIASDAKVLERARRAGLQLAQTVTFPSMALSTRETEVTALVALKAVSPGYPLRGALSVKAMGSEKVVTAAEIPAPATAWVDIQAMQALKLKQGDSVQLGESTFRVERLITMEPDRGMAFLNFAPRVMINWVDLPATGLVQPGSRVTYRLLVSGERRAMREFSAWAKDNLEPGQKLESLEGGRPETQRTLDRAERFLSLVALLAALVAAVAVAAVARRFSERHLDSCAVMRCLGLGQREILMLYTLEFLWVGCIASALGVGLGWGVHFLLLDFIGELGGAVPVALPAATLLPALQGFVIGLVLLLVFALPPLVQLHRVPPLRVLRKELGPPTARTLLSFLLGGAALTVLVLWTVEDLKLAGVVLGGFAVGALLFAGMAALLLQALGPLRRLTGQWAMSWRFALAAMQRRARATTVQLVTLAVGMMALLLLTVVRGDLIEAWRRAAPVDAPNRFLINIQPDQQQAVTQQLHQAGVAEVDLHPMIRGRLVAINDHSVNREQFEEGRAQRLVDREFNLSYGNEAPAHNVITQGRWFAPDTQELSMEEGIAQLLGLKLGDVLTFQIAGTPVSAPITSLRKVNWDSMRANFFVIMSPPLLESQPKSFMTAFRLPESSARLTAELLRQFPNLTLVDTNAILAQVQGVLDQVMRAVEFLFLFTLLAGLLVLYAALLATQDERVREAALLRALGATQTQLARAQTAEMLCLGALAGLLAAAGASATGWALARFVFNFPYTFSPALFAVAMVSGCLCTWFGGRLGLLRVITTPPWVSLREA